MIDFRRMFQDLPTPYMVLGTDLRFREVNARYLAVTQRQREDLIGRHVFDAFPESGERLERFRAAFEQALSGRPCVLEREPFAIPRPEAEGGGRRETFWTCQHYPVYGVDGPICGLVQKAEDVTSEVLASDMRDLVAREFDHRIRNILATVTSVARASAQSATSTEGFLDAFDGRIDALARTHAMLSRRHTQGVDLGDLVRTHLTPYATAGVPPRIEGPPLQLGQRQGQALGMALHELATNAAKYGAFSRPGGRLEIVWGVDAGRNATICWKETGLANVPATPAPGFGSKILTRVLPLELNGTVDLAFSADGLRCKMTFPHQP